MPPHIQELMNRAAAFLAQLEQFAKGMEKAAAAELVWSKPQK